MTAAHRTGLHLRGGIAWWISSGDKRVCIRAPQSDFLIRPRRRHFVKFAPGPRSLGDGGFFFLALLIVLLTKNLPYLKSLVDIIGTWHFSTMT